MIKVLVTGAKGFIGKNLIKRLGEYDDFKILQFSRGDNNKLLNNMVSQADAIVHLAGENRPYDISEFTATNVGLTKLLCNAIKSTSNKASLIFASSIQAELNTPYGESKLAAESLVKELVVDSNNPIFIYRLPNIFGKWCKPNYNSVVATFCHNIANDIPIQINDSNTELNLIHVDDLILDFIQVIKTEKKSAGLNWRHVKPEYSVTLGNLASQIKLFKNCRIDLLLESVGNGFVRSLYSTYVSYLPMSEFSYELSPYKDDRGKFVEILKTHDSGQFSFFTIFPNMTRGGHYHHTKTEKFLVIKGKALFKFENIMTNEKYEISIEGETSQVVETIPGWAHNITNIGEDEVIVILWANEIFDNNRPDTIAYEV